MRLSCRAAGELGRAAMFWKVCAPPVMFGDVNRLISSWNSEANVARSRRSHTFQRPRPSSPAARLDSLVQSLVGSEPKTSGIVGKVNVRKVIGRLARGGYVDMS